MRSIDLVAAHLVGDFAVQTHQLSQAKLTDPIARVEHVTRYCAPFVVVALASRVSLVRVMAFLTLVWITHFLTDSKRWLPNEDWAPGTIINDQALHLATLAVLGRLLG